MIEIKNLCAGYNKTAVLKDVSLNIAQSSFCAIIGKNGAGKSALLKTLCGLLTPFSGKILINGQNPFSLSKAELSKIIAFMPQNIEFSLPFSVRDFIMFGRYPYMNFFKIPSEKDYEIVKRTMKFTETESFADRNIDELSGGERQRVLIAQTIVQETDFLIFDEPTSHLDIGGQTEIFEILGILNKETGKTVIVAMHDLNAAGEFCDSLILLDGGRVKNAGTPEEVLNYKDIEEVYNTTVIVKTNPISGKPYIIPYKK
ncbi:MAG: ABC transporter ATP-binding protein [Endomicrobium sp.]|jgi:iron complex transport system ATP-binding protein|nr:ABC transporter ATP-binding protein [Endomicrobium sp.]